MFRVESGGTPKSGVEEYWGGRIPWATLADLPASNFITQITSTQRMISEKGLRESSAKMIPANSVIVSTRATIGRIAINRVPIATNQGFKNVIIENADRAMPEYVALALTKLVPTMQAWAMGGTFAEISKSKFCELQIPLPPLEVQKEIVEEIEGYQKVIDGARAVLDHYRPHIPIHPDWPMVKLGEVCSYAGGTQPPKETFISEPREGYVRLLQIRDYKSDNWIVYIPMNERHKTCEPEDVMIGRYGPPVFQILKGKRGAYNVALIKCIPDSARLERMWLFHFLRSSKVQEAVIAVSGRVRQAGVNPADLDELEIPLPSLATQQAIVAEIEAEQALVAANRELITRFEQKIQATLARIWGEDIPVANKSEDKQQ
ncbi:MAG: restriction endonuclease subunit S [Gammaproteobacteria bacterium]|nr:restriction endonuclease subunit S [Gammaproteobacteria bacterium]